MIKKTISFMLMALAKSEVEVTDKSDMDSLLGLSINEKHSV